MYVYLFKLQRKIFTFQAQGEASSPSENSSNIHRLPPLFLEIILTCLYKDLDLQTPFNLDPFLIRIRNISYYKLQTH
jgi:hypothetical protein